MDSPIKYRTCEIIADREGITMMHASHLRTTRMMEEEARECDGLLYFLEA